MSQKLNLEEHISSKEKKQGYVTQMFEIIAPSYDFFTVLYSYGMDRGWKRKLIEMLNPKGHERALDLACGTGDITFALGEKLPSGEVIGLDITTGMIEIANQKRQEKGVSNVSFQLGDIMKMPFADNSFDYVTCGYALRNVPDVEQALVEIKRVMKPGGRIISLDFARPDNRIYRWLYLNYLIVTGSLAGILMHGDADIYRYIPESLKRYPGQHGVQDIMKRVGFTDTGFRVFGGGIMALNFGTKPN